MRRRTVPGIAAAWSPASLSPQARAAALLVLLGWLAMFVPSYWGLSQNIWGSGDQGHGPIVLGLSLWLLWRKLPQFESLERRPLTLLPLLLLLLAGVGYALGRALTIWTLEIGAQIVVLAALILGFWGWRGLRLALFPLCFLVFMIPWPGDWVAAVTTPLKAAVSSVAADLLYAAGYPVGRAGVILSVGPYQLMVADACAGLNSIFTLEALGLFYMNIVQHTALWRNLALAVLVLQVSFAANVVRVLMLVLVTYYLGDAAGQGFVHDFAGLVLFTVALLLILLLDRLLGLIGRGLELP